MATEQYPDLGDGVPPVKPAPPAVHRHRNQAEADIHDGVKIFSYPKIIFIWPTLIAAILCGIGMAWTGNDASDPRRGGAVAAPGAPGVVVVDPGDGSAPGQVLTARRFSRPANLFAIFFVGVFLLNMIILSLDFPRFTLVGGILLVIATIFFLLWLSVYFQLDLTTPLVRALEGIFSAANAQFYFLIAAVLLFNYALIFVTRRLDYWEVRPNEILHHHGPLSDLERYPTMQLKFDKEIPDVLEFMMLGAGRLVFRVPNVDRAFVLDNVLWINDKELRLKSLMSRMEVRVTTDQEVTGS